VRVPTPVVSLSDVTMLLKRDASKEDINEALKKASKDPYYQGILGYSEEPLVSRDYVGNPHSGTVDSLLTNVVAGNLAKVVVWYDNEWGYSNRLVELVADVGRLLHADGGHEEHKEHHEGHEGGEHKEHHEDHHEHHEHHDGHHHEG